MTAIYNLRFKAFNALPPLRAKILHGRVKNYEALNTSVNKDADKRRIWSPYWWRTFKNYRGFQGFKTTIIKTLGRKTLGRLKQSIQGSKN